jgi:hypothetical protein
LRRTLASPARNRIVTSTGCRAASRGRARCDTRERNDVRFRPAPGRAPPWAGKGNSCGRGLDFFFIASDGLREMRPVRDQGEKSGDAREHCWNCESVELDWGDNSHGASAFRAEHTSTRVSQRGRLPVPAGIAILPNVIDDTACERALRSSLNTRARAPHDEGDCQCLPESRPCRTLLTTQRSKRRCAARRLCSRWSFNRSRLTPPRTIRPVPS